VFGIADVDLIPTRDLAARTHAEERLQAEVQSFHQARRSNQALHDAEVVTALLRMKFLQPSDAAIVARHYPAAEKLIKKELFSPHRFAPGILSTNLRSLCSMTAAGVSPKSTSTFTESVTLMIWPTGMRSG
jgi:hypothetical protein